MVGPGIQGNYYELKKPELFTFAIRTDQGWMKPADMLKLCKDWWIQTVPILCAGQTLRSYMDATKDKTVKTLSNGTTMLAPKKLREGIVVTSILEDRPVTIKQRSPEYLAVTEN